METRQFPSQAAFSKPSNSESGKGTILGLGTLFNRNTQTDNYHSPHESETGRVMVEPGAFGHGVDGYLDESFVGPGGGGGGGEIGGRVPLYGAAAMGPGRVVGGTGEGGDLGPSAGFFEQNTPDMLEHLDMLLNESVNLFPNGAASSDMDPARMWSLLCEFNESYCVYANNFTTTPAVNVTDSPEMEPKYWAILLILFPLFTVFGNILVVMSVYRERSLRTITNYFICSLAVADIMVAVVVMPPAVYMEVSPLCHVLVCFNNKIEIFELF
jgi:hypothetical protein